MNSKISDKLFEEERDLLRNKATRIALCEKSFYHFIIYYFESSIRYPELAPYHFERFRVAQGWRSMYVEWQRESAKSTFLGLALECWKICYQKADFICNICYNKTKATAFNKMLAAELSLNKRIKSDFWLLFSKRKAVFDKDEVIPETGVSEFVTTNFVKVKAFGMGESVRGEQFRHPKKGVRRPDHLMLDDIDNADNTKNTALIDKDMFFLQNEVFGGLVHWAQIIYLGNVVRMDWRGVRIREQYKENPKWCQFSNFIYGPAGTRSGKIQRSRYVETIAESKKLNQGVSVDEWVIALETLRTDLKSGFNQNYLGIPEMGAQKFVKAEWIMRQKISSESLPKFDFIQIGIDPAFSKNTASDAIGIVVTGHYTAKYEDWTNKKLKYVLRSKALEWEDKSQKNFVATVQNLYEEYWASRVVIESNNGGQILGEQLKEHHLAVDIVSASKDKVTRLKEHEFDLQAGNIFFVSWTTEGLISQLLSFTWEPWGEDDIVDAFVYSLFSKKFQFWFN